MEIGFHFSIQPSIFDVPLKARDMGCGTFQIFTRSNRQWKSKLISQELASKFVQNYQKSQFTMSVIHLPYLPNFASSNNELREKSIRSLNTEVRRAELLEIPNIVLHLGSHKGEGDENGILNVVNALEVVLPNLVNVNVNLETASGHPNSVGKTFDELRLILDKLSDHSRIGVCMDTAHIFAASYDLRTQNSVRSVFEEFDDIVGLNKLRVVHLNDSKAKIGSKVDRHEHIGKGKIGIDGFKAILDNIKELNIPVILETPKSSDYGDKENLKVVISLLR